MKYQLRGAIASINENLNFVTVHDKMIWMVIVEGIIHDINPTTHIY